MILFSSTRMKPFAKRVDDRVVVNVGSLGIEANDDGNNFMVVLSVYEGEGVPVDRVRIDMICHN